MCAVLKLFASAYFFNPPEDLLNNLCSTIRTVLLNILLSSYSLPDMTQNRPCISWITQDIPASHELRASLEWCFRFVSQIFSLLVFPSTLALPGFSTFSIISIDSSCIFQWLHIEDNMYTKVRLRGASTDFINLCMKI